MSGDGWCQAAYRRSGGTQEARGQARMGLPHGRAREGQLNPAWHPDLPKAGEGEASQGEGRAWPGAHTLTSPGSTLKSVCSTTPKSGVGSSLCRERRVRVWPPHRDSSSRGDRVEWVLGALALSVSSPCEGGGVDSGSGDLGLNLALPCHGTWGMASVSSSVKCPP